MRKQTLIADDFPRFRFCIDCDRIFEIEQQRIRAGRQSFFQFARRVAGNEEV